MLDNSNWTNFEADMWVQIPEHLFWEKVGVDIPEVKKLFQKINNSLCTNAHEKGSFGELYQTNLNVWKCKVDNQ